MFLSDLVAVDIFESLGYRILEVGTAEEALELLKNQSADISLVFTDIEMPPGSMNGLQMAA